MSKYLFALVGFVWLAANAFLTPAARGQSAAIAPSTLSSDTATAPVAANVAPPAKKIWTNDDLTGAHGPAASSGGAPSENPGPKSAPAKARAKPPSAAPFQQQIAKLQAQLPPIEGQIAELEAALSGKPVDSQRRFSVQWAGDWNAELAQLQKKRAGIEAQIQALEDQARHLGIATNALP